MKKIHIRSSVLATVNDCERKAATSVIADDIVSAGYELRHTQKGVGAVIGTSLHRGAEVVLDEKFRTGAPAPLKDMQDCSIATFDEESADGVSWDATSKSKNDSYRQIQDIARVYHGDVVPYVSPADVERSLEVSMTPDCVLTGHPDVIDRWGNIRDLKTGARQSAYHVNMGMYSLQVRGHLKKTAKSLTIDWIPRSRKDTALHSYIYDRYACEKEAFFTAQRFYMSIKRFLQLGEPFVFSANPSSVLCSPKYCRAFGTKFCSITLHKGGHNGEE